MKILFQPKFKFKLQTRLFLTHFVLVLLWILITTIFNMVINPYIFEKRFNKMQAKGLLTINAKAEQELISSLFWESWGRNFFLSLFIGGISATWISYWLTQRFTKILSGLSDITKEFSEGNFNVRMPTSHIIELNSFSAGFNRMAESLANSEQKRQDLVGDMTHELRTPLTVVRGYLEELADGRLAPSPFLYHQLITETKRLERLVNDLQELMSAQAGYLVLKLHPVQVVPILESLIERFSDQILENGPTLSLHYPAFVPDIIADSDRLQQVFINLIGNAIQYTESGSINVSILIDHPDFLTIVIQDTGIGISPEELPHVFDRFWRSNRARTKRASGTGIGLAISKSLIELQGGTIKVESTLGQGSTFFITLAIAL